jgi:hypothetical protein
VLHALAERSFPQAGRKINPGFTRQIARIVADLFDLAVSCAPINTGLQTGDSLREMEISRFNGLASRLTSIERCGLLYEDEKAVETA